MEGKLHIIFFFDRINLDAGHKAKETIDEVFRSILSSNFFNNYKELSGVNLEVKIPNPEDWHSDYIDASLAFRIWYDIKFDWDFGRDKINFEEEIKKLTEKDYSFEAFVNILQFFGKFEEELQINFIAANLHKPGSVSILGGDCFINENRIESIPKNSNLLLHLFEDIKDISWPKLYNISYEESYKWTNSFFRKNFTESFSPISRALAALTYILGANRWEPPSILI